MSTFGSSWETNVLDYSSSLRSARSTCLFAIHPDIPFLEPLFVHREWVSGLKARVTLASLVGPGWDDGIHSGTVGNLLSLSPYSLVVMED